ncbi:hypothetical protein KFK09_022794 [Dendrobium nobile]|uniref:Uncharacterized protein n=1 Tax=Dendrobium nobile TaxID=94219 RepID=A0A8T3AJN8_DENNO|nr:hypothetical protein KFK09_022794 [Dendrobium nobile]
MLELEKLADSNFFSSDASSKIRIPVGLFFDCVFHNITIRSLLGLFHSLKQRTDISSPDS